jgi:hypothetical protein
MDSDFFWRSVTGSAVVAAALTLARLLLDYITHVRERQRGDQRDAEARFERFLEDQLAGADRRLDRSADDLRAERQRSACLEDQLRRVSARRGIRR